MNKNKILKCKTRQRLDLVLQTCYPTIQEVEARGSWIPGQLRLHTKTLCKKASKQTNKNPPWESCWTRQKHVPALDRVSVLKFMYVLQNSLLCSTWLPCLHASWKLKHWSMELTKKHILIPGIWKGSGIWSWHFLAELQSTTALGIRKEPLGFFYFFWSSRSPGEKNDIQCKKKNNWLSNRKFIQSEFYRKSLIMRELSVKIHYRVRWGYSVVTTPVPVQVLSLYLKSRKHKQMKDVKKIIFQVTPVTLCFLWMHP